GWEGYEQMIREMVGLGDVLRLQLNDNGWRVANDTPLPVVCFRDARAERGDEAEYLRAIVDDVEEGGRAWLSFTTMGNSIPVARACISNYRNSEASVDTLIEVLEQARLVQSGRRCG
ncbi:MAG: hypothetical protein ACR2OD_03095, partial [Gaiellaceae bacterium]